MGYPYCPFVARPFIKYIEDCRQHNPKFGVRIHCGENVPFVDADAGAYRHFIAHMYIVFRCLRFLYRKLGYGIRIGGGIAFAHILSGNMSNLTHRKSSVLLAEMRDHAKHLLTKIAFEVNITSNAYLLASTLRKDNYEQRILLNSLRELGAPIILGTGDDGIWPMDNCPTRHPGHRSLAAEYCRAISSKLIESSKQFRKILKDAKELCFSSISDVSVPSNRQHERIVLPNDDKSSFTIIFHPDVIKTILEKYRSRAKTDSSCYKHYSPLYPDDHRTPPNNTSNWESMCHSLSRFVFFFYYTYYINDPQTTVYAYRDEYNSIFDGGPSFEQIYGIWKTFRATFMLATSTTTFCRIKGPEDLVFVSESSHPDHQQLQYVLEYLKTNVYCNESIRIFTRNVSEPWTTDIVATNLVQNHPKKASVSVFSTKNKDKYMDFVWADAEIKVNSKPARRTNDLNEDEKHMLYVICRHASAATAYLHCIGRQITNNKNLHSDLLPVGQSINRGKRSLAVTPLWRERVPQRLCRIHTFGT